MQETQETGVWSLGWEDPLEEGMATHSSILAWKILWTDEPGGPQFMGSQRVRYDMHPYYNVSCNKGDVQWLIYHFIPLLEQDQVHCWWSIKRDELNYWINKLPLDMIFPSLLFGSRLKEWVLFVFILKNLYVMFSNLLMILGALLHCVLVVEASEIRETFFINKN